MRDGRHNPLPCGNTVFAQELRQECPQAVERPIHMFGLAVAQLHQGADGGNEGKGQNRRVNALHQATLWRGGMASNALKQLIGDADWGELDYFLIDLPPGTSDIHLTVVQTLALTGAIVVSTPQAVALADARKGINMFTNDKVNVPILGLVENMAWFTPAELPENKYYIFGKEGAKRLAEKMNVPLLGQIPIVQSICESGDKGTPVALDENTVTGRAFLQLAAAVVRQVDRRNMEMAPTRIVEVHK